MKYINSLIFSSLFILLFASCTETKQAKNEEEATPLNFTYHDVIPQDFPSDLNIPNFKFPEDSNTLNGWIYTNDTIAIYEHAWGIWAGLTAPSSQSIDKEKLLVFETWMTPEEMISAIYKDPIKRSNRANLKTPNQLGHFASSNTVNDSIHESVSYSPSAANHAITNKLFLATQLYDYAKKGLNDIPDFPNDAITIKPVFKVLPSSSSPGQTKFAISSWHGTTDKEEAFGEDAWHSCVYIDITNTSGGDGSQLSYPNSNTPPAPTTSTTYNVEDFIHYTMNIEDAYYFNKEFSENSGNKMEAKPGDIVVLVGMHVTTKENKRWTWQTFWWAPDATNPPLPSSSAIAYVRPDFETPAANHYAMSVAYYMVNPTEPYTGSEITGKPNYAFNPYLEGGFGPNVFDADMSKIYLADGGVISTNAGVRTNCMSCHSMATANPSGFVSNKLSSTPYIGNSYVSFDDPIYKNQLKLDFAWSIEGNIDTTGIAAHIANLAAD